MDDLIVEEDKRRLEPEATHEEDTQPDPDEELMLDRGNGRVWLVKVGIHPEHKASKPRYLATRLTHCKRYPSI